MSSTPNHCPGFAKLEEQTMDQESMQADLKRLELANSLEEINFLIRLIEAGLEPDDVMSA
jgi:hypothetical protein